MAMHKRRWITEYYNRAGFLHSTKIVYAWTWRGAVRQAHNTRPFAYADCQVRPT